LKLIEDSGQAPKLAELLFYYLPEVWQGACFRDTFIVYRDYGQICKMVSNYTIPGLNLKGQDWLRVDKKKLEKFLAGKRSCLEYISDSPELSKPYRSHPEYGGHLPNRVIALSHTIGDMLKLSDFPLSFYAQTKKKKAYSARENAAVNLSNEPIKNLSLSPNFSARQIALTFFMLSHYVSDAHMPLHCDLRDSSEPPIGRRISEKLHPSIEDVWDKWFPSEINFAAHVRQEQSIDDAVLTLPKGSLLKVDTDPQYALGKDIKKIKQDEWQEMVYVTRVSYAVSRKWIGKSYKTAQEMISDISEAEFVRVSNFIFQDAVSSIARLWYAAWIRYLE